MRAATREQLRLGLGQCPWITGTDLAQHLRCDRSRCNKDLSTLHLLGQIARIGVPGAYRYALIGAPPPDGYRPAPPASPPNPGRGAAPAPRRDALHDLILSKLLPALDRQQERLDQIEARLDVLETSPPAEADAANMGAAIIELRDRIARLPGMTDLEALRTRLRTLEGRPSGTNAHGYVKEPICGPVIRRRTGHEEE